MSEVRDYCFRGDPLIGPKIISTFAELGVTNPDNLKGENRHRIYYVIKYRNKFMLTESKDDDPVGKNLTATRIQLTRGNFRDELNKLKKSTEQSEPKEEKSEKRSYHRWTDEETEKLKEYYYQNLPHKEISEKLGIDVRSVKNKISFLKLSSNKPIQMPEAPKDETNHIGLKHKTKGIELSKVKLGPNSNIHQPPSVLPPEDLIVKPSLPSGLKPLDTEISDKMYDLTKSFLQSYLIMGWDGSDKALVTKCVELARETLKQLRDA